MTRTTDDGSAARVSRREAVGLLATGAATLGARLPAVAAATETPPVPGLIRAENAKPGTRDWMLTHVEIDPAAKYRSPAIEGYCSHASVLAGDTLTIHVSTRPARPFTIDLYRMGWYGGDGGRLVASLGAFAGASRDDPPVGAKRLRRCTWPATTAVTIPADWPSGVYVGKLACRGDEAAPGPQSYVVFIVRDTRPADLVFQCSDFTWQAYNRWPDQFSLYDDGDQKWYWGGGVQVGFDRPYGKYCQILDQPLSAGSGEWFLWEYPFAFWLESLGYDVTGGHPASEESRIHEPIAETAPVSLRDRGGTSRPRLRAGTAIRAGAAAVRRRPLARRSGGPRRDEGSCARGGVGRIRRYHRRPPHDRRRDVLDRVDVETDHGGRGDGARG